MEVNNPDPWYRIINGEKGDFKRYLERMLYISYGSVRELETHILSAGDLDLIEKSEWDTLKKDIAETERMLKALIKSLENKPLNPGPLDPLLQLNWRRTVFVNGMTTYNTSNFSL